MDIAGDYSYALSGRGPKFVLWNRAKSPKFGFTTLGGYNPTQDVPTDKREEARSRYEGNNQKGEAIALLVGIPSMEKYGRSCGGEGTRGVSTVGFGAGGCRKARQARGCVVC